jgi:hypothetical protein
VIPSLTSFFSGRYMADEAPSLQYASLLGLLALALIYFGYMILKKYPDNIIEIRKIVTEITAGYLPSHITLQRAHESDDLRYIEHCLNTMINEMSKQHQQQIEEEHHQTIVKSVGILVDKISRPLSVIRKSLGHLNIIAPMEEERADITRCQNELEHIHKEIQRLINSKELKNSRTNLEAITAELLENSLSEKPEPRSSPCNPEPDDLSPAINANLVAA